jgi:hypothetical protein
MKIRMIMLAISLLSISGLVYAEGGCPSGMIPYSGTDLSSCGPIPAGYYGDNNNNDNDSASQSSRPPARWATTWGAIAFDYTLGKVGAVTGQPSEKAAEAAAISECRKRGGGKNCEYISITYYNQCAAMAWGSDQSASSHAATIKEASERAINRCNTLTTDCKIYYADCSLAKRIQ